MRRKKILIIIIISSILSSFFLLRLLGKKLSPILYRYVNVEVKRFASNVVNYAVNDVLSQELETDLFTITKNNKDEIEMLDYNTKEVNRLLKEITKKIQLRLMNLEDGKTEELSISNSFKKGKFTRIKNGVLCEIPMGSLRGNSLFVNLGPIIPIKMSFLGQVQANLNTKITNYGINNLVIEVSIHVEVEETVTMPAMSKTQTIKIDQPLTIKIIQGIVPDFYTNGLTKNSNAYSLPITEND